MLVCTGDTHSGPALLHPTLILPPHLVERKTETEKGREPQTNWGSMILITISPLNCLSPLPS